MKLVFQHTKTTVVFIAFCFLLACSDNQQHAASDNTPQQDVETTKKEVRKETQTETKEQTEKTRAATMERNKNGDK